jgi:hypothetical protein
MNWLLLGIIIFILCIPPLGRWWPECWHKWHVYTVDMIEFRECNKCSADHIKDYWTSPGKPQWVEWAEYRRSPNHPKYWNFRLCGKCKRPIDKAYRKDLMEQPVYCKPDCKPDGQKPTP